MVRCLKLVSVALLLFALTGCVSRYSSSQFGSKVVLNDNELNQSITTQVSGAQFLGKVDQIVSGLRYKAYIYQKGSDFISIGVADTAAITKTGMYQQGQDKELADALGVEVTGMDIRNFPFIDRGNGRCMLGLMNMIGFNDKMLIVAYVDKSALSVQECSSVKDIEGFFGLYPERAEEFVAQASQAIEIIQ